MAYTSSPATQTYSSPRISASYSIDLRPDSLYVTGSPLTQDAGMVNLLPVNGLPGEDGKKTYQSITRQAITAVQIVNSNLVNRGCYVWEKTLGSTYYFTVNGTGVYTSTDGTTWTLVNTLLTNATTPVRFTEFINDTNVKSLVMVDGVEGYVFTSNAAGTKIVDADFPTPHIPFPIFVDGYLFLAKANTADIFNSDLNDPSAWTAGSFISSELYPDDIQALVKINNYILAIGQEGSEYFYDVANATGTPLQRYDGGALSFGTVHPNSVASSKNQVIMLANNNDGEFTIKSIDGFKDQTIDPTFLPQALNSRLAAGSITAASVRGYFLRQAGDLYYVLAFQGDATSPNLLNKTFALNMENGRWTELRVGTAGDAPYPVYFTSNLTSLTAATYVSGHYLGAPFFGKLAETANAADVFNGVIFNSPYIYTELRTPNLDFDTANIKFMSRMGVVLTENSSTATTSGSGVSLNVSWSDDDYSTFSTARSLVFSGAFKFPFITQLGSFRQRAFKLTYSGPSFLRYKAITFDINKGQQ